MRTPNCARYPLFALFVFACLPLAAHAAFVKLSETPAHDQGAGVGFDGTSFYIAKIFSPAWDKYSAALTYQSTTSLSGVSNTVGMRALTYDLAHNTLFSATFEDGEMRESTTAGTVLQQWHAGPFANGPNAVAYDRRDGTLWLAHYQNLIEHRTRSGSLIGSFSTPNLFWTGLTIDPVSGTLLLMSDGAGASPVDDVIREYSTTGTFIATLVGSDQITGNGVGLYYDSLTAKLYATSQDAIIATFQDPTRPTGIPEPSLLSLTLCVLASRLSARPRRSQIA